jgi:molybdopterin molybdotransferase
MDLALEEALVRLLAGVPAPASEPAGLAQAAGRVMAERQISAMPLPLFDNSAVDGYAVRAADVGLAGPGEPVRLRVAGRATAGEASALEVRPGTSVRLFTGSALPRGADAVVMQEDTRLDETEPGAVQVLSSVAPGENVRRQGEDVQPGAVLCEAGEVLTAARISLLAAAGVSRVRVARRPLAGLLATGSELKEPGETLARGQIYESNRLGLAALAARAGAMARILPIVDDRLESTQEALAEAFHSSDVVVTSGGVSVGEMDFVKAALEGIGGRIEFWRLAIRPGRPFVYGRLGEKPLFGLPGNPVSALVTFQLLVRPVLLRMQGASDVSLASVPGRLAEPLSNPGGRRHFVRVRMDQEGNVGLAGPQGSHLLSSMAAANGLVDLPPGAMLHAGTAVRVMRWD